MKTLYCLIIQLLFMSCHSNQITLQKKNTNFGDDNNIIDSTVHKLTTFLHDTISVKCWPDGFCINAIRLENNTYTLLYGYGNSFVQSNDTVESTTFDLGLNIKWRSKKGVCLSQNCGTSCTKYYVLPTFQDCSEVVFYNVLAFDTSQHRLVYCEDKDKIDSINISSAIDTTTFLVIVNYCNSKTQQYIEIPRCQRAIPDYCIDSLSFTVDGLYVKWWSGNFVAGSKPKRFSQLQEKIFFLD